MAIQRFFLGNGSSCSWNAECWWTIFQEYITWVWVQFLFFCFWKWFLAPTLLWTANLNGNYYGKMKWKAKKKPKIFLFIFGFPTKPISFSTIIIIIQPNNNIPKYFESNPNEFTFCVCVWANTHLKCVGKMMMTTFSENWKIDE